MINSDKNVITPINISYFKTVIEDICCENKKICIFKSLNNIFYFVYSNLEAEITFYDLMNEKIIAKIKNAYLRKKISLITHFTDITDKKDLLLTLGFYDAIKIWDVRNYECLLTLEEYIPSGVCFLNDNGKNYLITKAPRKKYEQDKYIKVYDLKGNQIKIMDKDYNNAYFIETFYDKNLDTNYIITNDYWDIKSYDFKQDKLYHKYNYSGFNKGNFIVEDFLGVVKLICADQSLAGKIIVFNFHLGNVLNIITLNHGIINCFCLWNKYYLFAGCQGDKFQLINLDYKTRVKEFNQKCIYALKKINHPKYGECLVVMGDNYKISIWK